MSLIGIDFGNRFGVVAAAKKSGVDVLENERGHRQTPNMVWYPSGEAVSSSQKQRCVGERAATNFSRNAANTVTNVKRWLGVSSIKNAADEKEQSRLTCSIEDFGPADESRKQTVLFNVGGRKLCPEQVAATYLLHLKQIGEKNLQMPVQDVVLSVPGWWNQRQRQALLDSASIAGLNVKRLLNEHTAVALTYGIERTDLHPTKARKVLFVDMGHSCTTAQVVAFVKGKMTVLGVGFDPCLGGRDFDEAIADFVAKDIKEQYGIEVHGNPRLWQRVLTACEKQVKYPMGGGNPRASLTIDEIDDDTDYEVVIERELFNNLIDPLVEHISIPVLNAMKQAGIHFKDLSSVEIVGGGMRLLRCQEYLSQKILNGFKLSRTMNMEEGVAQGCAYMCAILSSRMDPFQVIDKSYYPISFKWMPLGDEEWQEETHVVFKRETSIPDETRFKFVCEKGIRLCAFYSNPSEIPCHCPGDDGWIGTYVVSFDESTKPSTPQKIHIHFALDGNGLFSVVGAEPCEPAKKKAKKNFVVNKKTLGLSEEEIDKCAREENQTTSENERAEGTKKAKYLLETYLKTMRDKLKGESSELAPFCREDEITDFLKDLDSVREWLGAEGKEQSKEVYEKELGKVKRVGDVFDERKSEFDKLSAAIQKMESRLDYWIATASPNNRDETYSHIVRRERDKVCEKCSQVRKQLQEKKKHLESLRLLDPVRIASETKDVSKDIIELDEFSEHIMNQPKPVVKNPETTRFKDTKDARVERGQETRANAYSPLTAQSPFPNNKSLILPDLQLKIPGIDRIFLVHRCVLATASVMFEKMFSGEQSSCCMYDKNSEFAQWKYERAESGCLYTNALLKWLEYCYGADKTFSVSEYISAFVALLQLNLRSVGDEMLRMIADRIKNEAETSVENGAKMLEECVLVYGDIIDERIVKLREVLVKSVMKPENFDKKGVGECLMKLPLNYLDMIQYGRAHTDKSEFSIRAKYVGSNRSKLTAEEKRAIMRNCIKHDLDKKELKVLEELSILSPKEMGELIQRMGQWSRFI